MKFGLPYREQLRGLGDWMLTTFDNLTSSIQGSWRVEHTDDDRHGHVHATTLQVGRVSHSDILSVDVATATLDDFNDARLRDAGMLRLALPGQYEISVTGIQVPQDELGNILDGRVLVLENTSTNGMVILESEGTASSPANRFALPWVPEAETEITSRYFCVPGSLTVLIYNKVKARWIIQARSNNEIESYQTLGTSQNDYAPVGNRAARVWKLAPTAANLTISGFDASTIIAPTKKTIINEGLYRVSILHMSTSSAAANRVQCPGGSQYYVNPRESVDLYRDVNDTWIIKEKADQWIDVAYAAGNFTANSGGAWGVASGDVGNYSYQIDGNKMTVAFELYTTDVTSGPSNILQLAVPAGRTIARTTRNPIVIIDAGGVAQTGQVVAAAGQTVLYIYKDFTGGTNWTTTAADDTYALGQITFMVYDAAAGMSELHTDTAHADTAHADGGHTDVAHVDAAHVDTHSDVTHSDSAHSDTAHSDSHSDVAFVDTAHSDVAHGDGHSDSHDDVAFVDVAHEDSHGDSLFQDGPGNPEIHTDEHADTAHSDTSHSDTHGDTAHSDSAHSDTAHSDTAHSDAHSDTAHADGSHSDTPHADSHSDTPHSDTAHSDASHTDTVHADSPHQDVGYHTDTSHTDI